MKTHVRAGGRLPWVLQVPLPTIVHPCPPVDCGVFVLFQRVDHMRRCLIRPRSTRLVFLYQKDSTANLDQRLCVDDPCLTLSYKLKC